MTQPLVLAIEPDLRQAAILKRIVREKALADLAVVDSRDAAIEAMRTSMPDVLLLSALMSPRDEDELMAHLRTLDQAGHLQTHTIPQLASSLETTGGRVSRGLLSAFLRKKEPEPVASGCDPDLFAEEIRVFIQRAGQKKRELAESGQAPPDVRSESRGQDWVAAPAAEAEPASAASSWSSPFEWKPSGTTRSVTPPPERAAPPAPRAPVFDEPPPLQTQAEPVFAEMPAPLPDPVAFMETESAFTEMPAPLPDPVAFMEAEPVVEPVPEPFEEPVPVAIAATSQEPEPIALTTAAPFVEVEPIAIQIAAPADPAIELEIVLPTLSETKTDAQSEWAAPPPAASKSTKGSDRLGPLAGWARIEQPRQAKPAAVTADDVRALISSLSVPPAVASVTYARGCRIRRVRVPAATEHDRPEAFGTVILSRRALAEQRERRPSP